MKPLCAFRFVLLLIFGFVGPAYAAGAPVCSEAQMLAYVPNADEVVAHRRFTVPTLTYPFGVDAEDYWGFRMIVRVDESGNVLCYRMEGRFDRETSSTAQRRGLTDGLRQWHYSPFLRDGKAVSAILVEEIYEQEAPRAHLAPPDVALEKVHIGLRRTVCFGECPSYSVDVYGDGRVVYKGEGYVDVLGEHVYRIPTQRVAKLVASLQAKEIWSLRDSYRAPITDHPAYDLTLDFGGQVHVLEDYVGRMAGMPSSVSEFEDEIDDAARTDSWIHLGAEALEQLKATGFNFRSQAGADLLARAVMNESSRDDEAMLRLVELGAPISGAKPSDDLYCCLPRSVLDAALVNQRTALIDALIERGALETNGTADQRKIEAAFRAAIIGGRLQLMQKIWSVSGTTPHPSLTFDDASEDEPAIKQKSQVSLLLQRSRHEDKPWDALAIAKWLAAQGCELKATNAKGNTLLHIATGAGDVEFVRYLLDQGLDASTRGEYGLPALGSAYSEDIAMLLLEAGTDLKLMSDSGNSFRRYAKENHWGRVVSWLDSH